MLRHLSVVRGSLFVLFVAMLVGCAQRRNSAPQSEPVVTVTMPVQREVSDVEDFRGETQAIQAVEIKARVTGPLTRIGFEPGQRVKGGDQPMMDLAHVVGMFSVPLMQVHSLMSGLSMPERGDILFEIDARPYQADYDQALAQVAVARAKVNLAIANLARAREASRTPGSVTRMDLDTLAATQDEAQAQLVAARASLEMYRLNLSFTKVRAPIDGKVGRNLLSIGNLVTKDTTLLTTIVSEDPVLAYFPLDSNTMLRVVRALRSGKIKEAKPGHIPVFLGLDDEAGYPHEGTIDFINNAIDSGTGTITLRGVFANPKPEKGPRLFTPGMSVRIRLPISEPYQAILIPDQSIGTDQDRRFVYVVDAQDVIQYRKVELGELQEDGLRVVHGLKPGERIVSTGLQRVGPGMKVKVDASRMALPTGKATEKAMLATSPGR